jgi:hypothetical protein
MEIQTTLRQTEKPKPIERDSRGTLITPQLEVAYNFSGTVVRGTILSIDRNEWVAAKRPMEGTKRWWYIKFEMKVKHEDGEHISTIKNPNSFIVI